MDPLNTIGEASKVFPFLLAAGSDTRIDKTRMLEALIQAIIIGALVAAAGYYVAFPVLQKQVEYIAQRQEEQYQRLIGQLQEYRREREIITLRRDAQYQAQEEKIVSMQIELAKRHRQ